MTALSALLLLQSGPAIDPRYTGAIKVLSTTSVASRVTQMVWGPDGKLYASSDREGVLRFRWDRRAGKLTADGIAAPGTVGCGIGFDGSTMYVTTFAGELRRLRNEDGDGTWGETGETNVALVRNIPKRDHQVDQLVVRGASVFIGIGTRTINGHDGLHTMLSGDDYGGTGMADGGEGRSWGESAWGGTIAWIENVRDVPSVDNAASPVPDAVFNEEFVRHDARPYTTVDPLKLVVHSAGARNPYGLALRRDGALFLTNNFNRTNTNGDGTSGFGLYADALDADFANDVHDQLFLAVEGGDYGYANTNWRGQVPMLTPGSTGYQRRTSITFDNLFNQGPYTLHDPANPIGLGPHSSSNGSEFAEGVWMPRELVGRLFVTRFTGSATESDGDHTLTYGDVVAVNVSSGNVRRVFSGLNSPLDVQVDPVTGFLLVVDYVNRQSGGKIYVLGPKRHL